MRLIKAHLLRGERFLDELAQKSYSNLSENHIFGHNIAIFAYFSKISKLSGKYISRATF